MGMIDNALNIPMLRFNGFKYEARSDGFQSATALYYLIHEGRKKGFTNRVKTRAIQHLRNIITSGREPCMDAYHMWHYPMIASSITLAKNTPEIWDQFGEEDIARFDTIMECFVYLTNFIANDSNEYRTGLGRHGNVFKEWNANYKIALISPIVFASIYFGGADVIDKMLKEYSHEALITKLTKFGFNNILEVWNIAPLEHNGKILPGAKELTENGGAAYVCDHGNVFKGGTGMGIKIPFIFKGFRADDIGIIEYLISDCYGGGEVFSHTEDNGDGTYDAYIYDETTSPMEGMVGLMSEFKTTDGDGIRSDAWYCEINFIMMTAVLSALKELGAWSENNASYSAIVVGNTDLIYKLDHGYMSYSLGRQYLVRASNIYGYDFIKDIWERFFEV